MNQEPLSVDVLTELEQLKAVAREWDETLESSRSDTVFLTSDWLISWWEGYHPPGSLFCLLVRDQSRRLLGVGPFFLVEERRFGLQCQVMRLLGDGTEDSEYLDMFCRFDQEEIVFPRILAYLGQQSRLWDICEWNIIPEESLSLGFMEQWAARKRYQFYHAPYLCSHIPLPDDYDAYLHTLHKKFRQNIRYYRNRAANRGQGEHLRFDAPDAVTQGLQSLYALHEKRWNRVGEEGKFTDLGRRAFYEKMTFRFSQRGWLRLSRLDMYDQPAAAQIGFLRNGVYSALQEGFDPDLDRESPGVVLRAMAIEELIASGARIYDFLGFPTPGKERWGTRTHMCRNITVTNKSFRAKFAVQVPRFFADAKKRLRTVLPKSALRLARKFGGRKRKPLDQGHASDYERSHGSD